MIQSLSMKTISCFIITFISLQTFAVASSTQSSCIEVSKSVLFMKAVATFNQKYAEFIEDEFDKGQYSHYDMEKLLRDKQGLLPNSLCSGDIQLSIKEYINQIQRNCLQQPNEDEIKTYIREIGVDAGGKGITSIYDSVIKTSKTSLESLEQAIGGHPKCDHKKEYLKMIDNINTNESPQKICLEILQIVNKAKLDKVNCPTK